MLRYTKMGLLGIVIFFGSAFSIMAFHNDIGIVDLFAQIYSQVIGYAPDSMGGLEIGYSAGLALGVLMFYNHLSPQKRKTDPTPLQVEMSKYEQDLEDTIRRIQEKMNGKEQNADDQKSIQGGEQQ